MSELVTRAHSNSRRVVLGILFSIRGSLNRRRRNHHVVLHVGILLADVVPRYGFRLLVNLPSTGAALFRSSFQVSSPHVNSAALNRGDLHLSNESLRNSVVVEPYKPKSSTGFAHWIPNDPIVFDTSVLLEVLFQLHVAHRIVEASHEHLVPNRPVLLVV